jgi:hypothetical protein
VTRRPAAASPVQATEQWFVRHGLPYFVPSERAAARAALRPRRTVPIGIGVGIAAAASAVTLSWLLGDPSLGAATLTLIGVVSAAFYAVTALRGRPILKWTVGRTLASLHLILPMVTRALPLLLLFVTFLFINAEAWQLAAHLDGGVLWLTVLLFAAMAVVFLLVRLPEELDVSDDTVDADQLRRACRGTPLEGEVGRLIKEDGEVLVSDSEVRGYERANLVLVLLVAQVVQVLVLAVAVFAFFMVFGSIVMEHSVQEAWTGGRIHALPVADNLSVELVQVSVFLAAFSGLYFTVTVLTDETYRAQFFTGVMAELDQAVGVRAAYLALRERDGASREAGDGGISPRSP